jgi:electron transport complex protein RnfB
MSIPLLVLIRETECIGCAKCLPACPVDAIIGASGQMHSIINDFCIGCKLCIPVCPVNCIELTDQPAPHQPEIAKKRAKDQKDRLILDAQLKKQADWFATMNMKNTIAAAIARAKQKL